MRVAGIDPGSKGAICVMDTQNPAYIASLYLIKESAYTIAKWLHEQSVDQIWIEDVHSIFGVSAKSNFSFGKNVGIVSAVSLIIVKGQISRVHLIAPKVWQKYAGVTQKGKFIKTQVAELVTDKYPGVQIRNERGTLLDGVADAAMIAHYGMNN